MQIKITLGFHLTPVSIAKIKDLFIELIIAEALRDLVELKCQVLDSFDL